MQPIENDDEIIARVRAAIIARAIMDYVELRRLGLITPDDHLAAWPRANGRFVRVFDYLPNDARELLQFIRAECYGLAHRVANKQIKKHGYLKWRRDDEKNISAEIYGQEHS